MGLTQRYKPCSITNTLCLSFQVDPVVIASDGVEMFREEVAALFLVLVQLSILIPL